MLESLGRVFEPSTLESIKEINTLTFSVGALSVSLNVTTIVMTWIVMTIVIALVLFVRRLEKFPGRIQAFVEWIIESFDNLVKDTMGEVGRKYLPLICTIFFFILISNWLSIIPLLKNPTSDLNTTLGLGVMVLIIAQVSGVFSKGLKNYLRDLLEPIFIAPLSLFINVAGELGKTTSHSFRLFGNILGGGLILLVCFEMPNFLKPIFFEAFLGKCAYFVLWPFLKIIIPVALNAFFGLFVGTIQAFVFTILALAYITVARS